MEKVVAELTELLSKWQTTAIQNGAEFCIWSIGCMGSKPPPPPPRNHEIKCDVCMHICTALHLCHREGQAAFSVGQNMYGWYSFVYDALWYY